jgi:hypothetical protein
MPSRACEHCKLLMKLINKNYKHRDLILSDERGCFAQAKLPSEEPNTQIPDTLCCDQGGLGRPKGSSRKLCQTYKV